MEDPMSSVLPPRPPSSGPPPLPSSQGASSLSDNLRVVASRGQVDNARDLLAAGAGFEPDEEGRTALHLAAQQGHTDVCKVLTSHGCEVNAQDTMGYSPLLRAASMGVQDTVHMLLESGCDPDLQDEHGNAAIHEACWNGFSKTAEVLVNFHCNVCLTNRAGFTALHLAAQNGHNECSRVLLYAGCDSNMKNNYGDTALHTAARYGHAGVARILISAKCLLSEHNKNGDTALHIASALKRRKIAKILVESGLDTDVLNKQGETAADVAQRKDHPEIVIIITNFSKPKAKQSSRRQLEGHHGVTFKDEIELADGPVVCPEDELTVKAEPETKQEKQERRFFFFKKKKKETKDKPTTPSTTQTLGQPNSSGKQGPRLFPTPQQQAAAERQKAAVLGFFSQYVPRDGVQLYRDLAGNIKQGPIGYAPVCQCGPSLKKLETSITDTRQTFHNQLDSSHNTLNQRIHNLNMHVNRQTSHLRGSMRDRFDEEHGRCHERITERLNEERMETEAMMGRNNEGMKEEIESWLNDKLASYGHCLDHHHDDTALPPRNLFLDFPTMGRLVRSRSDETLSVSDYSGKNRKKDFYASRQAAMQQIRGWELPGADVRGRNNKRREHNNNHIASSNKNILVSAAEVHNPPAHLRNPQHSNDYRDYHNPSCPQHPVDNILSPSTNSTTSPDMPATAAHRNYPHHSRAHSHTPTRANDPLERPRPQPRVSFSPDPHHHQHPHSHQRHYSENPYQSASPSTGPPKAVLKPPTPQYNSDHPHHHSHQQPRHPNLPGEGPHNAAGPKSVELEDSSKISAQLNGRHSGLRDQNAHSASSEHSSGVTLDSSSQDSKHDSLRNQMKRYQDDYGVHYNKHNNGNSPEVSREMNPNLPPTYPRPMPRSRSVDNTLDEPIKVSKDPQISGYITDSGIRSSIRGATPSRQQFSSRESDSPSPGPPPRSATRYRLPETSSGYNSQPPYNRVQSPRGYNRNQPHSILKGGSANTINTTGVDRQNQNDIAAHIGLTRYQNSNSDKNLQSVSMYGINITGKVSPLVYSNETYARMEDFSHGSLDVPSKSDSNILSSSSGNNTPLMDCLQHDSFLSPSASPSPNYIHGSIINKEDSTCSSNQDSGYDSRANRIDGGIRRNFGGGDNSTGTPSSSFSMERNSCVPSNWSGSPINTSTDNIASHHTHDGVKEFPANNHQYNSNSGYPSDSNQDGGQTSRPTSSERGNARHPNINNSNSFNRGGVRDFSPFRQGDAIRSHLLPQSQTFSPNNQQRNNVNEGKRIYDKVPHGAASRDSSVNRNNGNNDTVLQNSNNDSNNTSNSNNYSTNSRTGISGNIGANNDHQPMNAYSVRNQTVYNYNSGDELYSDRNYARQQNDTVISSNPNSSTPTSQSRINNTNNNQPQQSRMSQRSFCPSPPSTHRQIQPPTPNTPQTPANNRTLPPYPGNPPSYIAMNSQYNNQNSNNNNSNTNNQRRASAIVSPSPNNWYHNNNTSSNTNSNHHQNQPAPSASTPDYIDATQNKVQAHVEGWYQRKLMEAAQRLRDNPQYGSPPSHTAGGTTIMTSGHSHSYNTQDQIYSSSPATYSQSRTQDGYRNNNNNNNNGTARSPPNYSHSFHTKQPSRSFSPNAYHSDRDGFNPHQNTNASNNSNNPHLNPNRINDSTNPALHNSNGPSVPSFNRNGGPVVNSDRSNMLLPDSHVVRPPPPQASQASAASSVPLHPATSGGWNNGSSSSSRDAPSVYGSTFNSGAGSGSGVGGPREAHFARRGSGTPMRYDPIHGSDV